MIVDRPIIITTPRRTENVFKHRFSIAHEIGHLLLHSDSAEHSAAIEKQADEFATASLTSHLDYLRSQSQASGYAYLDLLRAFEENWYEPYALGAEAEKWFEREGWFTRVSLEGWRSMDIDLSGRSESENYRRFKRFDAAREGVCQGRK